MGVVRHPTPACTLGIVAPCLVALLATPTGAQAPVARAAVPPEISLSRALQSNPVTAPYAFRVVRESGRLVLAGRVGSRRVHDVAIQTALALGIPVRDDLIIDTGEAQRVAAQGVGQVEPIVPRPPLIPAYYVYPQPLLGRVDDPFYGMEPPLVTYPPGWPGAITTPSAPEASARIPGDANVEVTVDTRGVALLRGAVKSAQEKQTLGLEVASVPGIVHVENQLEVGAVESTRPTQVPPPPQPFLPARGVPAPPRPDIEVAPPAGKPIAVEADPLSTRVAAALARRPALAGTRIEVTAREGVVTLSGRVPTALEAMLAFRAAQQTPGVREINDRLSFDPPDVDRPNPLRSKARPEELEPYLLAQIRRQLGDLAHVDRVEWRGDGLAIHGTVAASDDVPRVEAALRSIPLLRGFRLESHFRAE